jgi:hypothetical protein
VRAADGGGEGGAADRATRSRGHIRRIANAIRANKSIDSISKMMLGMRERSGKPKQLTVPNEPPHLRFVRALHESGAMPMHELAFGPNFAGRGARP